MISKAIDKLNRTDVQDFLAFFEAHFGITPSRYRVNQKYRTFSCSFKSKKFDFELSSDGSFFKIRTNAFLELYHNKERFQLPESYNRQVIEKFFKEIESIDICLALSKDISGPDFNTTCRKELDLFKLYKNHRFTFKLKKDSSGVIDIAAMNFQIKINNFVDLKFFYGDKCIGNGIQYFIADKNLESQGDSGYIYYLKNHIEKELSIDRLEDLTQEERRYYRNLTSMIHV